MPGFDNYSELLDKLGKHKISKSCLYINKLADVDISVVEKLIEQSYLDMKKKYLKITPVGRFIMKNAKLHSLPMNPYLITFNISRAIFKANVR